MIDSLKWYLKWKVYLLKKDFFHVFRSPKMVLYMSFFATFYAIYQQSREATLAGFALITLSWVYLDFLRGVPNRWKRQEIVNDYNNRKKGDGNNGNKAEGR